MPIGRSAAVCQRSLGFARSPRDRCSATRHAARRRRPTTRYSEHSERAPRCCVERGATQIYAVRSAMPTLPRGCSHRRS